MFRFSVAVFFDAKVTWYIETKSIAATFSISNKRGT